MIYILVQTGEKYMFRFMFSLLLCINAATCQNIYKVVEEVTGRGESYRRARLDCFRQAIEKTYGINIQSSSRIKNFTAIADTILSRSKGFIKSYSGERVKESHGEFFVSFKRIIVSQSSRELIDRIKEIEQGLANLHHPAVGIKKCKDVLFLRYIQAFLIKKLHIKIVPPEKNELTIQPHFQKKNKRLLISGEITNRKGEIISSVTPFSLRYFHNEDRKYAAQMFIISLFSQMIIAPVIKVHNIDNYLTAKKIQAIIKKQQVVIDCSFKKYENQTACYTIRIKGNIEELCSTLIATELFCNDNLHLDQNKRILKLYYKTPDKRKILQHSTLEINRLKKENTMLRLRNQKFKRGLQRLMKFENQKYHIVILTNNKYHSKIKTIHNALKKEDFK